MLLSAELLCMTEPECLLIPFSGRDYWLGAEVAPLPYVLSSLVHHPEAGLA
jgi:hypothetical protein